MNDPNVKTKQQIVDKIKSSTNILVTVSRDPTVDDLSAAIGLTAVLNNMGKHATAIFSGAIPPAITFLEPDKVFEGTADSLRDFIIALDKEKADHLRYKIEGDVVKIFITPYRTTITGDDLEFSQGDFNVELVLALGVANKDHLDNALAAHGQILHDVMVATFSAGENTSNLGAIDWHDDAASSLCEMVASVIDSLKTDKPLFDKQISTAIMTGVVFATDRFSNVRTTSKVMALAAQLMAAGADQQLIAAKLNESHEINSSSIASIKNMSETDGTIEMPIEVAPAPTPAALAPAAVPKPDEPGTLRIAHEEAPEEVIPPTSTLPPEPEAAAATEAAPAPVSTEAPAPLLTPAQNDSISSTLPPSEAEEPTFGGTLNATTDEAAEENRREQDNKQNKTILSHSYLTGSEPNVGASINSTAPTGDEAGKNVDIFAASPNAEEPGKVEEPSSLGQIVKDVQPLNNGLSTLPPVAMDNVSTLPPEAPNPDEARAAVEAAFASQLPPAPVSAPAIDLPMPPPVPDFSNMPAQSTPFDFAAASLASTPGAISEQPVIDDPAQFKIPA